MGVETADDPLGRQSPDMTSSLRRSQITAITEHSISEGLDLASLRKLVNLELEQPISYNSYKYFVEHDPELVEAWRRERAKGNSAARYGENFAQMELPANVALTDEPPGCVQS